MRSIARGGMAAVYEVQEPVTGERQALKILHGDGSARPRFDREYEALLRLNHPNVIHVYKNGFQGDSPWYTMELVEGTPLQRYARQLGKATDVQRQREILRVGHDLCLALHHIHRHGVVHRDLKSANVLVMGDGRVKVIDFGTVSLPDPVEIITKGREFIGTFAYASPEQIRAQEVNHQSDLYALGVLLYRAFTGKLPFRHKDVRALALAQLSEVPVPPRSLVPNLPEPVEAIILALMAKEASARPASALAVASVLREQLGNVTEVDDRLRVSKADGQLVGQEVVVGDLLEWIDRAGRTWTGAVSGARLSERSAVVEQVVSRVEGSGWRVVRVRAGDPHRWIAALRTLAQELTLAGHRARAEEASGAVAAQATTLLEVLAGQARPPSFATLGVLFRALVGEWSRSGAAPLLWVFHCGPTGAELVRRTLEQAASDRLGSMRVRVLVDWEGPLQPGSCPGISFEVEPLDVHRVGLRMGALLHRRPPPVGLARAVWDETHGWPAQVDALVQQLVQRGGVSVTGRSLERLQWAGKGSARLSAESASTRAELEPVGLWERRLLELLIVAGEPVRRSSLAALLGASPGAVSLGVGRLVGLGSVRCEGEGADARLAWAGGYGARALEQRISASRRLALERALLVSLAQDAPSLGTARLALRVADADTAVEEVARMVERLFREGRPETALGLIDGATQRWASVSPALRTRVLVARLDALLETQPTSPAIGETLRHLKELGQSDLEPSLILVRARLFAVLGHMASYRATLEAGWKEHAKAAGPRWAAEVSRRLAAACRVMGEPVEAEKWDAASAAAHPGEDSLHARLGEARTALRAGKLERAEQGAMALVEALRPESDPSLYARAVSTLSRSLRLRGRFSDALAVLESANLSLYASEVPYARILILLALGWCEVDLGRLGRAQELVEELDVSLPRGAFLSLTLQADLLRSRVLLDSGEAKSATRVLQEMMARAERSGYRVLVENGRAGLGMAMWASGEQDEARAHFEQARAFFERQGDVPSLYDACVGEARSLSAERDPEQIFAPIADFLQEESAYPGRLERILARAEHQSSRRAGRRGAAAAWLAARQQLELIARNLTETDRATLRLHPWSRRIRRGTSA
ncbi:MAG: protein kinase [Deltaproteobacteria bacterium]|nr:protein kinase [Deltaproteobacteria bacterium]